MEQHLQHLRLLSIFHYVMAALFALFALLPLGYVALGAAVMGGQLQPQHGDDPQLVGGVLIGLGLAMSLFGLAYAALVAWAGRCLSQQRHHTLCMVAAVLLCLFMPLGTVLGVFTLVVLSRPEVKALFASTPA